MLALAAPANALVLLDPAHLQRRLRLGLDFTPAALASAPAGRVVVAGQDAAGWGRLALVDVGRARVAAEARVGRQPSALALAPDGSRLLLADSLTRSVSVLDAASLRRLALINLDFPPSQLTSLPYGSQVFALGPDQVAALDWRRGGLLCDLPVGSHPQAMVLKPDGGELYVSNAGGTVSVIDTSTDVVSATLPAGAGASGLAVAPDGSTLYVANTAAGTVSALDLATRSQLAVVRVGEQPASLVLGAGGGYLFVADRASNDVAVVRSNRDPNNPNTLVTLLPAPAQPRALLATAPPAAPTSLP